jgi:hypothetical protein
VLPVATSCIRDATVLEIFRNHVSAVRSFFPPD